MAKGGFRAAGLLLAILPGASSAATIGIGQTVELSTNTTYTAGDPLVMDGGQLRFAIPGTGGPLTLSATDAVLGRGMIDHWYSQSGVTSFEFYGTTSIPGAVVEPFPADAMYLRASPFDSTGLAVVNKGSFVQTGTGELVFLGRVRFVADLFSSYFFDNDLGIRTFNFPGTTDFQLINNGSSFVKRAGSGTSTIDVPIVHNAGKYETWSGYLALNAGGSYQNGTFYGEAFSPNPNGGIVFSGGVHAFKGFTTSEFGNFRIDPGVTVSAQTTTPVNGGAGEWRQRGALRVEGTLEIDGSVLNNTGSIETVGAGVVVGRPAGGYVGTFQNSGSFIGDIRPTTAFELIDVNNDGQFTIPTGRAVEVGEFVNSGSGALVVDGTLSNLNGGALRLRSGVLQGSGLINGEVFVGGDPTTALFRPGNSPGTMTIDGGYVQESGGELELEIGGIDPGQFDVVDASDGHSLIGGTIRFERVDGYPGDVGEQLTFFAGGPVSIDPSVQIVDNTGFELDFDRATGTATITVPEPGRALVMATGLLGLAGLASRRRLGGLGGRRRSSC